MYQFYTKGADGDTFRLHAHSGAAGWEILRTGMAAADYESTAPLHQRRALSVDGPVTMDVRREETGLDVAVDWTLNELESRYGDYHKASIDGVPWAILSPRGAVGEPAMSGYVVMGESGYSEGCVPAAVATPFGTEFRPYDTSNDPYFEEDDFYVSLDEAVVAVAARMGFEAPAAVTPGLYGSSSWLGEIHVDQGDGRVWVRPMCWRGLHWALDLEEAAAAAAGQVDDFLRRCESGIPHGRPPAATGRLYRFGYGPDILGPGFRGLIGGQMWEVSADGGTARWEAPFRANTRSRCLAA